MKTSLLPLILCIALGARLAWGDDDPLATPPLETPSPSATAPTAEVPNAPPPPAQAPQPDPLAEARAACATDVQNLCPGVRPGGGRVLACLKLHKAQVSEPCRQAVTRALSRAN